ncbi:hypothetical protein ACE6H2_007250 [Prunus campanulata]
MKNVGEKNLKALTFVENLKKQHGDGISTLCLVYNATGDTVTYSISKDWCGHIGHSPYPTLIANGQSGAFLHVQSFGKFEGSVGNVVYNGKTKNGEDCGWMLAWNNNRVAGKNSVHTENRPAEHYVSNVGWIPIIYDGLNQNETWGGCVSTISTGTGTSPIVEAILTLEDA